MADIVSTVVSVFMFLVLGVIGLAKMSGHRSASTRIDKLETVFEKHIDDDPPHARCTEHTVVLKTLSATLTRLEGKMDTLDIRVYNLVKNGGRPPTKRTVGI